MSVGSAVSASHLLAHVDLGEAEGAEVRVGAFHRRLNGLSEQLVHKLADERPHLLHRLKDGKAKYRSLKRKGWAN